MARLVKSSMFTGIIEEKGRAEAIERTSAASRISVFCPGIFKGIALGDSVAVNGVCLTVSLIPRENVFTADVMPETFRRSNLALLQAGDSVNLERAMPANGRFGGHIVAGHIDGTGKVLSLKPEGNAVLMTVSAPAEILRYVALKGSIAIDGVSLTVAAVDSASFTVSLIPFTASETTLLDKRTGDPVNLETDIIAKYVEKLMQQREGSQLTLDILKENGFC